MTTLMTTQTKPEDEAALARQAITDVDAFAELYRRHAISSARVAVLRSL
jgi:hypothetical protein